MAVDSLFGSLNMGGGDGGLLGTAAKMILAAVGFMFAGGFTWWMIRRRKRWNIKVEFRVPRDVREEKNKKGEIEVKGTIIKEWGKGYYNPQGGVVFVKRKGKKAVPMKPFDVKRFLSGKGSILTVIQVGIEDYRPILEDSYLDVEDMETGDEAALIKSRIDTSESKSWRNMFERDAKSTYTVMGWLHEHGQLIGFGFIILLLLIGQAIVIGKLQ